MTNNGEAVAEFFPSLPPRLVYGMSGCCSSGYEANFSSGYEANVISESKEGQGDGAGTGHSRVLAETH